MTTEHNRPVRLGVVGCGYWGAKHLRVFNELEGCELVALCEVSAENVAKQPRGLLPPLVTGDYDRFLSTSVEAVTIATPARTHYQLAMQALERGKHVLIEKPFATSTDDALDLISVAEQRGLTLAVGHTYVYHPAVEYLRRLVQDGHMGPLQYVHAARLNFGLVQPDVDVLWDLAPHDISILLHILAREPRVVGASGTARLNPERCEITHLDLQFPDGPFAHIYSSWLEPTKVRRFTFVGEELTVVYDDVAPGEMIRIYDQSIRLTPRNGAGSAIPRYLRGDTTIPHLSNDEPLKNECRTFLESVRTGRPMTSDGWSGLSVVRVLEAAERSLYGNGASEPAEMEPAALRQTNGAPAIPREPTR